MEKCVNYVFKKFKGRPDLINPFFFEYIDSYIKSNKTLAIVFLTKFIENV